MGRSKTKPTPKQPPGFSADPEGTPAFLHRVQPKETLRALLRLLGRQAAREAIEIFQGNKGE